MACSQTLSGITNDCAANMGGIVKVYLANKADVTVAVTTSKVTSITMASSAKFKEYQFRPGTSSMSSNYQVNQENGVNYVQTDLLLVFTKMETTKRVEVVAMAQGELVALVRDANGTLWFLGFDEPLRLSAGDGLTGTARGDRNGYSVTLQDNSKELPFEVLEGTGGIDLSTIVG